MTVRAYWAHTRISLREDFRYFWSDSFWNGAITAFYAGLLILFYDAAGRNVVGGLTWSMTVWYLFAVQFASASASNFVKTLTLHIRSGEIVSRMSRPSNYIMASFGEHLGSVTPKLLACFGFMLPLGAVIVGFDAITLLGVAAFALCVLLAIVLDFSISLILGLLAFWTEDARPYRWIYNKIIFIIGGMFFPLDIYPEAVRNVVQWLPPAFLAYHPASVLVRPTAEGIATAVFGALAWIGVFALIGAFVWRAAVRRVEVNGG